MSFSSIGDWNAKVGSLEIQGVTDKFALGVNKWSGAKANRVLSRKHTGYNKHPLPRTDKMTLVMDINRGSITKSDWLYSLSQSWRTSIQSAKSRPEAEFGSDHELLIAKFRLKLKTVGKTARLFRYDLNQSPYDYTVEVTNRFKGLDLVNRVPQELWTEVHNNTQEMVTKTIPKGEKMQEVIVVVWGGLTNSWEKKRSRRERYAQLNAEFQRIEWSKDSLLKWTMQRNRVCQ